MGGFKALLWASLVAVVGCGSSACPDGSYVDRIGLCYVGSRCVIDNEPDAVLDAVLCIPFGHAWLVVEPKTK
jgi:hypothetical protein